MTTQQLLDRLMGFIQSLTEFYGELSQELPDLRVIVDNTRVNSEVKKMPRKCFAFRELRGCSKKILTTYLKAMVARRRS